MKTFKTQKGTELPFLNLKGKDYLQVAHRLVWFREEYPEGSITTEFVKLEETYAIAKARIFFDGGSLMAVAHGREDAKHFPDFIEKAETKAIGRALALCGFGTQFAPELDEEDRLADSPTIRPRLNNDPVKPATSDSSAKTTVSPKPQDNAPLSIPQKAVDPTEAARWNVTEIVSAKRIPATYMRTFIQNNFGDGKTLKDLTIEQLARTVTHIKDLKKPEGK